MRRNTNSRGFTMLETAISVAVLATIALGVGGILRATSGLASTSHATQLAAQQNRRALERIVAVMRSASSSSLSGFDVNGVATSPSFQPVTGLVGGALGLGSATTVEWNAKSDPSANVASPGQVDLVLGGVRTCLASRVAAGGFRVSLSGETMVIDLTTYVPTADGGVAYVSGRDSVALRN